jgi:hypothetical protein
MNSRSVRITPFGAVVLVILAAAVVAIVVGSGGLQTAGLAVAAVIGLVLVNGLVLSRSAWLTTDADRVRRFRDLYGPRDRRLPEAPDEPVDADALWHAERERRLEHGRQGE